jgi:hypothetical protein
VNDLELIAHVDGVLQVKILTAWVERWKADDVREDKRELLNELGMVIRIADDDNRAEAPHWPSAAALEANAHLIHDVPEIKPTRAAMEHNRNARLAQAATIDRLRAARAEERRRKEGRGGSSDR